MAYLARCTGSQLRSLRIDASPVAERWASHGPRELLLWAATSLSMAAWSRRLGMAVALSIVAAIIATTLATFTGLASASNSSPAVATPYTATFNETGLPAGTIWTVHVSYIGCGCSGLSKTVKSNLTSIVIPVANGTYNYNIQRVSGYYVVGVAHGTFTVSGANLPTLSITFNPVYTYLVEFSESGLPVGTTWTVTTHGNGTGQLAALENLVGHSYGTTLDFMLPNGSYHYTVAPINGSYFIGQSSRGTFVVAGASPSPIPVTWTTPVSYAVTFTENGLPAGMNWSVRVVGWGGVRISETVSSETPNVTFYLPNGSYRFVVAVVIYFNIPTPSSGSFAVTTLPEGYNIAFTPVAPGAFYPVAFQEGGLANGTHWWVKVIATHTFGHSRTVTASSNGTTLFFLLQNGSYRFVVHGPRTYTITSGGAGAFSVLGGSPSVFLVGFTPIPTYSVTFTESGLPAGTNWSVLVRTELAGSTPWYIRATHYSNTSTITFTLPSGVYCFKFNTVPGYTVTVGVTTGPFSVSGGSPPPISAGFSPKA